jgi:hypothetical protein
LTEINQIEKAVQWYQQNMSLYKNLTDYVATTVRKVLDQEKINYQSISKRIKSIDRYREKALRKE